MTTLAQWQAQRARNIPIVPYEQPDHAFLANLPADMAPVPEEQLRQHVLPGAKRAITHTELAEWQNDGLTEHQMVERVNARHRNQTGDRTAEFQAWKQQVLDPAVERARKRMLLRAARAAQDDAALDKAVEGLLDFGKER